VTGKVFDPGNRLIAALDVPDAAAALDLIGRLQGGASFVKLGLELYVAEGPALVKDITWLGNRVMLDLKLHDIPETVARATDRAAQLGAQLLTVHAGGGRAMLKAAVDAAGDCLGVLAVTVLTSLDDQDLVDIGFPAGADLAAIVERRARLAIEAGCAGVVASPKEAARIRAIAPPGFLIVTPGVRPPGASLGDQKRVLTPAEARTAGADLVVVGRPIRDAADPGAVARQITAELAG
jgi:orotidine-5'-phosphate decarboxylase